LSFWRMSGESINLSLSNSMKLTSNETEGIITPNAA
jgi:hypothetical protein